MNLSSGPTRLLVSGLLALTTVLVYLPALRNGFVNFDDPPYVLNNSHVHEGISGPGLHWAFTTTACANWHPLTWLSLQLDAQLFGLRPWGFHLTNVLLHAVNAVLLFWVLQQLTGHVWRAATVAALFALHPLHVESVAWVAERKDVLSTLFFLVALSAYAGYVKRPSVPRYVLVILAFGLGLLAKPMLVTLPCLLLLLDYWPLGRLGRAGASLSSSDPPVTAPAVSPSPPARPLVGLVLEKLPLFGLAAASCVVTVMAQGKGGALSSADLIPFPERVANAVVAYVQYLGKAFWPRDLAVYYPHPGNTLAAGTVLMAALILVALTAAALVGGRRWPYLAVGWLWYLGTLVPVIGLVQVGSQALADRYTYIPLIGVFIMAVWGVADLLGRWLAGRVALAALTGVVLGGCALGTWEQLQYWRDSATLWTRALQVTSRNAVAHNNLGAILLDRGKLPEATEHFQAAVRDLPDHAEASYNLGTALFLRGEPAKAVPALTRATQLRPDFGDAHYNLGLALLRLGAPEQAVQAFTRAIDLQPSRAEAYNNRGIAQFRHKKLSEAAASLNRAVDLKPKEALFLYNLATVLHERGQRVEAEAMYRKALALSPQWPEQARQLAWKLANAAEPYKGDIDEAVFLAKLAHHADGKDSEFLEKTLQAARAAAQRRK
jgi:tetratricopeptide (TPR) repeat protein